MEYDVTHTLEHMGHEVRALGLGGDLGVITEAVKEWKPHIVFNLMENFEGSRSSTRTSSATSSCCACPTPAAIRAG